MKYFFLRRSRNIAILVFLIAVLWMVERLMRISLRDTAMASGWLLISMVFLLAAYNARKKFPFLPLGSSASWLQVHIYVGLLSFVVFGLHIGWQVPNGVFESMLALVYLVVFGSGIAGLVLSRVFARRITMRGPEVLYQRIPRLRHRLRGEAEQLVLECLSETGSTAVPEFYSLRLEAFFSTPKHFVLHLFHSMRPRRSLVADMAAQYRFLDDQEKVFLKKIEDRVKAKDDLDYQFAHQASLKYWLFIHVPITWFLLVFAIVHGIVVYSFKGGMS